MKGHRAANMNPLDATITNAHRQPIVSVRTAIMGGPTMRATLGPLLNSEVAKARCLGGNHSETDLMAAGKLPDSVMPSIPRQNERERAELLRPVSEPATDHVSMERR